VLPGGSVENFDVPRISKLRDTCVTGAGWEFFSPLAWMWLNNRSGPTADKKVRQAIMYAVDRNFAKDVIWNGLGKSPPGRRPRRSNTTRRRAKIPVDPAKAKALLKEAGYKGEKIRMMPLPYGETWLRWGEAVKQNLQDVGINIETVAPTCPAPPEDRRLGLRHRVHLSLPIRRSALGVGRNYITSQIVKGQQFNQRRGLLPTRRSTDCCRGRGGDAGSKRKELYEKAQKILVEDVPVAWLLELQFPDHHPLQD